ncbi:MAG: hypothetical protein J5525_08600 [Lachnospiraceae bacterium]|nr:hypothetical protein [Lachnospiraceae bacterium]
MSEDNGLNEFFTGWFASLEEGLDKLDADECSVLFGSCASRCAKDAVKYLYRDLFDECKGDLDLFFSKLDEKNGIDGKVIESGKVYELIFYSCECPLKTEAGISSPRLCECSKVSMICVFKELVGDREFSIEQIETILNGSNACHYRITFA